MPSKPSIPPEAVEAFWKVWIEEGELPYMARIRDFSPGNRPASEEEWAAFHEAQEEAEAQNDALIARSLEAAAPHLPGLDLSDDELDWLEGAALRAADDEIAKGLGTDNALRVLAAKLTAELQRRRESEK